MNTLRILLPGFFLSALVCAPLHTAIADPFYWGGGGGFDVSDGTPLPSDTSEMFGYWDTYTKNWSIDSDGTTYVAWDNSLTDAEAIFGTDVGTKDGGEYVGVVLDEDIFVNKLTLDYRLFSSHNERVGFTGTNTITFNGIDPTISVLSGNSHRFEFTSGTSIVSTNGLTRSGAGGGQVNFSGDLTGVEGVFTNISGDTNFFSGGLTGLDALVIQSGGVRVNAMGTAFVNDLADDMDIILNGAGGTFEYQGSKDSSFGSIEFINKIVLQSHGQLDLSESTGSGSEKGVLILNNATNGLDRGVDGKGTMMLRVEETGNGVINSNLQINNGTAQGLLPFIHTSNSGMVRLNAENQFELVEMTSAPTDISTWVEDAFYRYDSSTSPTGTIANDLTIAALGVHHNAPRDTLTFNIDPTATLTIGEGFISATRGSSIGRVSIVGGSLTSGTNELYIVSPEDSNIPMTIASEITGDLDLILVGQGQITLGSGNVTNSYTGNTYVNGGNVSLSGNDNAELISHGDIFISGNGTLTSNQKNKIHSGANLTIRDRGTFHLGNGDEQTFSGVVRIEDEGRITQGVTGNGYTFNNSTEAGLVFQGGSIVHTGGNFEQPLRIYTDVRVEDSDRTAEITNTSASTGGFNHRIFLSGAEAATRTFDVEDSSTLDEGTPEFIINQQVQDGAAAGGIRKTGAGTMVLAYTETVGSSTQSNLYSGGTTVQEGTLLVNNTAGSGTGTGFVQVDNGATLGGFGIIAPTGSNSIDISGTTAPGASIGELTFDLSDTTGNLVFEEGADFLFELGEPGTGDLISIEGYLFGNVEFNDNVLNFYDTGGLGFGTYTLFSFDFAHGFTDGLVIGTGLGDFTAELDYLTDPNLIQLHVIPEPGPLALLGVTSLLLLLRRRRRA